MENIYILFPYFVCIQSLVLLYAKFFAHSLSRSIEIESVCNSSISKRGHWMKVVNIKFMRRRRVNANVNTHSQWICTLYINIRIRVGHARCSRKIIYFVMNTSQVKSMCMTLITLFQGFYRFLINDNCALFSQQYVLKEFFLHLWFAWSRIYLVLIFNRSVCICVCASVRVCVENAEIRIDGVAGTGIWIPNNSYCVCLWQQTNKHYLRQETNEQPNQK